MQQRCTTLNMVPKKDPKVRDPRSPATSTVADASGKSVWSGAARPPEWGRSPSSSECLAAASPSLHAGLAPVLPSAVTVSRVCGATGAGGALCKVPRAPLCTH